MAEELSILAESLASLERLQAFDPKSLIQAERLGASAFSAAVEPASRLISFFKLLPLTSLEQFPEAELSQLKSICDSVFAIFSQVLEFDPDAGDNKTRQQALVLSLESQYQNVFTRIYPLIAYSTARTVDFNRLDEQGRAASVGCVLARTASNVYRCVKSRTLPTITGRASNP